MSALIIADSELPQADVIELKGTKPTREVLREALEPARVRMGLDKRDMECALDTAMALRFAYNASRAACREAGLKTLEALAYKRNPKTPKDAA